MWESAGIDYNQVKALVGEDKRITHSHMQIPGPDGDRGFGGACFPKDTEALLHYARKKNLKLNILEKAVKTNSKIR